MRARENGQEQKGAGRGGRRRRRRIFASFERGLYDHEEIHVKRAARGVSRRIDSGG